MHKELVELAAQLARLDKGKPRQASLRRSISTAYYALFHALCDASVTALIGRGKRPGSVTTPIYRMLDHGAAKRVLLRFQFKKDANNDVQLIADAFIVLQEARLEADYDPSARFEREEALDLAAKAALAIHVLRHLTPDVRLDLVVQLISKQR